MKRCITIFLGVLMLSVFLAACGSIESKIIGNWKVVTDYDVKAYLEVGEDRIVNRQESNDNPMTAEYILTETEDDNFIIEVVNPESGINEFFFEGHFVNKDTVEIVDTPNGGEGNNGLIRVDSISEEMEKDKKEEAVKEKEETEETKQLAKIKEEEKTKQLAIEKEGEEEAEEAKLAAGGSDLKQKYLRESDGLEGKIMKKLKESYPHAQDMRSGFYGQYYGEWDDLLQNVWDELEDTIPKKAFEKLKTEQIKWIEMKELAFGEMSDETASARAEGMDYLAFETKDRIYYLVENYLD
ncbi:lysozyme inhibitor LprI family protein [Virgibacillus sp. C22-A2]|uniref:Lysozyme inhibitor LprI family protein n=1 Tax=Virgibacillus tibetensis TaxID=3042313 RepID=A0ABU6KDW1_9BACI|nr:lysozyme inhibitor LprI family protein [Virgibacillus sp. C22-A2]